MRTDWLQAFLKFSECMNFTRAAAELNISQPALHVKIGKLADWLGQPLYLKAGRNLVLTPAGELVSVFARDEHERLLGFVEEFRHGAGRHPVVLCAGNGAYLYLLGPAISQFLRSGAHLLKLLTGDRDHTVQMVLTGQAHLGVTALGATPPGISVDVLTDVGQIVVMPRTHRLAKRRKVLLADLEGEALIVPPPGRPHRVLVDRMLMNAGVSWSVAVEANGWELMLHFARLQIGLAIVNGCCLAPPGLVARPLPELPKIRYQIVRRTTSRKLAGADTLRKQLLANRNTWQGGEANVCSP